ncbi:DnaD domain protein [Bacillus sp. EB106-08-02-XG196]|uniref:DnaD domain protein n=1 Tax=Bacillus sp. EB106-08-02-XG196 TaxID=2737049 RepID=UPI0015C46A64|nr:DnaD domain protein [Bacillus sp. EB106-08-02-XG196]NWQ43348.1 DnaD domain protein [Bacillus sp. EB106-08-02-XG196]
MAKFRKVRFDFWMDPMVSEEMTPEDRYFYLYLLTNQRTTQIGIYQITKKQIAFDMGYSIESVHSLMERFIMHHQLIRYNPETRELAIKNWGETNFDKAGKPMMDCILSELKDVKDISLLQFVLESIKKQEFRSLYESFMKKEEFIFNKQDSDQDENHTYLVSENEEFDDTCTNRNTIRGQEEEKEKEKDKEEEKEKQQEVSQPIIERNPNGDLFLQNNKKLVDVKEIIEFWDNNGFGFTNVNAKEQLLSWLDDSTFLQPKAVILKALNIACANNKRRLSYVVGILKNWENESLLTVEEIDYYQENQKPLSTKRKPTEIPSGRYIPRGFDLDITAGEDW